MSSCLIKRVAVLLLLWTALDLCVPGFCQTDGILLPRTHTFSAITLHKPSTRSADQTANDADHDEDCFCCCSHIVHSQYFVFEIGRLEIFVNPLGPTGEPHEIALPHFRPPRV